jgi:DNA-binding MarR family transcriptional regulator/N-acetylglutamate synthase-like GNAT family acetyltransferase
MHELSQVLAIRQFNRFYTNIIGLLDKHVYGSPLSLMEARILFEIATTKLCTATVLRERLDVDRGYMSRLLKHLENQEFITKKKSEEDNRHQVLCLTGSGDKMFVQLTAKANQQVLTLLEKMPESKQRELVGAMETIEKIISGYFQHDTSALVIRTEYTLQDINQIIERHQALYAQEQGFDLSFRDYVTTTFAADIERIWIAEKNGQFAGCVGLVKIDDKTAQLRWLLLEPEVRRLGLGKQLVQHVIDFCKEKEYKQVVLSTVSKLHSARNLYRKLGFRPVKTEPAAILWGQKLEDECWELYL